MWKIYFGYVTFWQYLSEALSVKLESDSLKAMPATVILYNFFFHRGQNKTGKFKGWFWELLQLKRRSKGLSRKMLNCFVILIIAIQSELLCKSVSYCLITFMDAEQCYFKSGGNRRWHFPLKGWTVTLRLEPSECVSGVSCFDGISVVKKEMQGGDACTSGVWVTQRTQCYKQLIPSNSILNLIFLLLIFSFDSLFLLLGYC